MDKEPCYVSTRFCEAKPPANFETVILRIAAYLDRTISHAWSDAVNSSEVPLNSTCLVQCKSDHDLSEVRCLAFANKVRGKIRWFGVAASWHEPEELYGVVGYIEISKITLLRDKT